MTEVSPIWAYPQLTVRYRWRLNDQAQRGRDWWRRDRNWVLAILMVASPLRFEFFMAGGAAPEHVGHRANSHPSRLDNIVTRACSHVATAVTGDVFL